MRTSRFGRTAPARHALATGSLVLLLLTGCVWADTEPVPLVPEIPVPESAAPESPVPPTPAPNNPAPTTPAPEEPPPDTRVPGSSTIVYSVEGTGTASVTYMAVQGGSVVQESTSGMRLPFSATVTVPAGAGAGAAVLTLIAVGSQDTETLACTITRNGEVVAEQRATGPLATVTCNSTNR